MATKKDLVEAYSFSRRRLVTAFVSGAPGGREVEPTRPGRTIIGGIALAVLLVAGALVLGILKSPTDVDWSQEGLFSDKGTGADYVNLAPADGGEPILRPIINITSAMLLLGADVESTDVPEDEIAERTKGGTIGILQAPTTPPAVGKLLQSGWTSCTTAVGGPDQGIRTRITPTSAVTETPDAAFVVRTPQDDYYVIAEAPGSERPVPRAYAYPVTDRVDTVLQNVTGVDDGDAVAVPSDWVSLFPAGRPLGLDTFGLSAKAVKKGRPSDLAGDGVVPAGATVGTVLADQVTDNRYVLLRDTALQVDRFALAVYTGAFPEGARIRTETISGTPSQVAAAGSLQDAHWPSALPTERQSGGLCAVLDAEPGQAPGVRLARADTGSEARADGTAPGDSDSTVEPGSGALVYAGDFDGSGVSSLYLVDDRGFAHRVRADEERQRLGYGDVPAEVVPSTWVGLFQDGVLLSVDAARCPPTTRPQADDGESCAGA